jgi:hypothetical protein
MSVKGEKDVILEEELKRPWVAILSSEEPTGLAVSL